MVREHFPQNNNHEALQYASELIEMANRDQQMRRLARKGDAEWDEDVDQTNTKRLKEIVTNIGWPTQSKVGREAYNAARLIVQHSDDVAFQKQFLKHMKADPETEPRDLALLEDRVRVREDRPQLYGTQFTQSDTGELIPYPIEDRENVDERRQELGMRPLADYKRLLNSKYNRPAKGS